MPEITFRTYIRGQNIVIDPETQKEMEERRRRHLEHQEYIKKQVKSVTLILFIYYNNMYQYVIPDYSNSHLTQISGYQLLVIKVEEKQKLKREEREKKIREEMEEEKRLQADRDRIQKLYEMEQDKQRSKEVCIFAAALFV